jgi:dUTP pyrophosphatase
LQDSKETLRVCVLHPELVDPPKYASHAAAGLDLQAALHEPLLLKRGGFVRVPTGLAIQLPSSHEGQVRPRSGLAARHGVTLLNSPGTIDADYRGEIQVLLVNHGPEDYWVQPRDRVAQLVVAPVSQAVLQIVSSLNDLLATERGDAGFGSTGR